MVMNSQTCNLLKYEVIWGHIDILVVAVRRLSRRWKVKTLLAGPSPTSPVRRRLPTPLFPTQSIRNLIIRSGPAYFIPTYLNADLVTQRSTIAATWTLVSLFSRRWLKREPKSLRYLEVPITLEDHTGNANNWNLLYSNASALSQSLLTLRAGVVQDLALFWREAINSPLLVTTTVQPCTFQPWLDPL